jgi:hypothetical protein
VSEEIAYDVLDWAYDPDTTLSAGAKRSSTGCDPGREATRCAIGPSPIGPVGPQEGIDRIDFGGRPLDTGAMGVRTRGLDVKAGAARLKADRAAREEAELVVDRWNRRLTTGRDMPAIRGALIARAPGSMSSARAAGPTA